MGGDLNHIPSWHAFTHTHTHRQVTLKKDIKSYTLNMIKENVQPDNGTSIRSGYTLLEEFPVYLAEGRLNVSYVSRDMSISYPVPLQLGHGPHRPKNT